LFTRPHLLIDKPSKISRNSGVIVSNAMKMFSKTKYLLRSNPLFVHNAKATYGKNYNTLANNVQRFVPQNGPARERRGVRSGASPNRNGAADKFHAKNGLFRQPRT
jgi:hypothetical protein